MKTLMIVILVFSQTLALRFCGGVESLTADQYKTWIELPENGLHVSKTIKDYQFDLQYKPAPYAVLQEYGVLPSSADFETTRAEIAEMQYYTLRISNVSGGDLLKDDVSTIDQFSTRLAYFTNEMQNDISLIENGDTLPCLLFHFERTYGVDPRSTFLLGFDLSQQTGDENPTDKIFLFEDHELGTGHVMMTIAIEDINKLPSLKSE